MALYFYAPAHFRLALPFLDWASFDNEFANTQNISFQFATMPTSPTLGTLNSREGSRERNVSDSHTQAKSLFVHSLSETVTTESLTSLFSQFYPLKHATVVQDPVTKRSKGYGFATFADSEDAQKALDSLNGFQFEGRKLKIEVAERRHRSGKDEEDNPKDKSHSAVLRSGRLRSTPEQKKPLKLIIRNLPWTIKEPEQLADLFRSYGKVKYATIPVKKPGLSAGYGFVLLRGRKNAETALDAMNGKEIEGRILAVDWAVEKDVWEAAQRQEIDKISPNVLSSSFSNELAEVDQPGNGEVDDGSVAPSIGDEVDDSRSSGSEDDNKEQTAEDLAIISDFPNRNSNPNAYTSNSSTLFIRNLPFSATDEMLREHFIPFGPIRYARVVVDFATNRSRGTGFVCFYRQEDAETCLRDSPRPRFASGNALTSHGEREIPQLKQSILEDPRKDPSGRYTLGGRVLQVSQAVDKGEAEILMSAGNSLRDARDKDRRRLYLLSEGTIPPNSPIYQYLAPAEINLRQDSMKQRQTLLKSNPSLHLSLTRLSVRNLPRSMTSKTLKALAREAVVCFARDVKAGLRKPLSKEELSRGGPELRDNEKERKAKGKGIVRQAKIVFEGREGKKVSEDSGAGRSRGYGFIEYTSHRWSLMGLRWLNGYVAGNDSTDSAVTGGDSRGIGEKGKRLIVEFAIENAQVVGRRLEKEIKARERSKLISEKKERREIPSRPAKNLDRDTITKRRNGVKRKRDSDEIAATEPVAAAPDLSGGNAQRSSDLADRGKRQRIIVRKRMLRRARKGT